MSLLLNNKRRKTQQASSDPYWNNVVLFLKGDGTNGSTNIVDSSPSPKTLTVFGNTQISTAQSKYGSSIYFDGNGDYLSSSITGGLGQTFTLEFWVYLTSTSGMIFNSRTSGIGGDGIDIFSSFRITTSGVVIYDTIYPPINSWFHVAITRNSSNLIRRFINGVQTGTPLTVSNTFSGLNFFIGGNTAGNIGYTNGYIDSLRFTQQVERYTSNFNPETDTYLN